MVEGRRQKCGRGALQGRKGALEREGEGEKGRKRGGNARKRIGKGGVWQEVRECELSTI